MIENFSIQHVPFMTLHLLFI